MYTCAHCSAHACLAGNAGDKPGNCPMREENDMRQSLARYDDADTRHFLQCAAAVESEGYCEWPRLREVGEFCRKMGYERVGLAFCMGLAKEAKIAATVLSKFGFAVESIACKTGGFDKSAIGIEPCHYLRPGNFEAMCNPVAQADFLHKAGTQFNVVIGLCVGHDSLFYKHSQAPVTTLIAKDRALAHNPAGALYCADGIMKKRLTP